MKVIDLEAHRRKLAKEALSGGKLREVPVLTFAKGKFTLALQTRGEAKRLVVYNTATKVEIAEKTVVAGGREAWIQWAETIVDQWQRAHGHVEEPPE